MMMMMMMMMKAVVVDVGCSGLGYSVGAMVALLLGAWQWSLRVSENKLFCFFFFFCIYFSPDVTTSRRPSS